MTSYKIIWIVAVLVSVFVGVAVGLSKAYAYLPRKIVVLLTAVAGVGFVIGLVYSDSDHRYRILSMIGICLICAGVAYTFTGPRLRRSK